MSFSFRSSRLFLCITVLVFLPLPPVYIFTFTLSILYVVLAIFLVHHFPFFLALTSPPPPFPLFSLRGFLFYLICVLLSIFSSLISPLLLSSFLLYFVFFPFFLAYNFSTFSPNLLLLYYFLFMLLFPSLLGIKCLLLLLAHFLSVPSFPCCSSHISSGFILTLANHFPTFTPCLLLL